MVSVIKALGGVVIQENGSRVRLSLNGISLNIYSPHPQKELKRYQVQDIRTFLEKAKGKI